MTTVADTGPDQTTTRRDGSRRLRLLTAGLVTAVLAVGAIGCSSDSDTSSTSGGDGSSNATTPSGEGAGGGPAPTEPTGALPTIADGVAVSLTGTLSGVKESPDQEILVCEYLTTADAVLALEFTESNYEVISNVEPIQLEINDATTGAPVAGLGDAVTVSGIQHPDPIPVGGKSYRCEGATAYLWVTSIAPAG